MDTRNAQTVIAEIKEIDARIQERFVQAEVTGEYGRTDERNADDRERLHDLALELVDATQALEGFVREVAAVAIDGDVGADGERVELENDDAWEELTSAVKNARELLA